MGYFPPPLPPLATRLRRWLNRIICRAYGHPWLDVDWPTGTCPRCGKYLTLL